MASFVLSCLLLALCCLGCGDVTSGVSSITLSPSSATVGINQSQSFSVVAKDSTGKIVTASPTWSVSGSIGTISSSGLFVAGASGGSGTVTASYSGLSSSATVTITENGWVEGRVTDSAGYRVESMKVYLDGTSYLDFTDSDGDYSISDVAPGTYNAKTLVTDVYYASSQEVTVSAGGTKIANFTISYFTDPPDLTPPDFPTD